MTCVMGRRLSVAGIERTPNVHAISAAKTTKVNNPLFTQGKMSLYMMSNDHDRSEIAAYFQAAADTEPRENNLGIGGTEFWDYVMY